MRPLGMKSQSCILEKFRNREKNTRKPVETAHGPIALQENGPEGRFLAEAVPDPAHGQRPRRPCHVGATAGARRVRPVPGGLGRSATDSQQHGQCQCAREHEGRDARRSFRCVSLGAGRRGSFLPSARPLAPLHPPPRGSEMALVACPRYDTQARAFACACASGSRGLLRAPRSAASRPRWRLRHRSLAMASYGGGHSTGAGAEASNAPPSLLVFSGDCPSPLPQSHCPS